MVSSVSSAGLMGMRERVLELGGEFTLGTPAGGGTAVRVRIGSTVAAAEALP